MNTFHYILLNFKLSKCNYKNICFQIDQCQPIPSDVLLIHIKLRIMKYPWEEYRLCQLNMFGCRNSIALRKLVPVPS